MWPAVILLFSGSLLYLNIKVVTSRLERLFGNEQNFIIKYLDTALETEFPQASSHEGPTTASKVTSQQKQSIESPKKPKEVEAKPKEKGATKTAVKKEEQREKKPAPEKNKLAEKSALFLEVKEPEWRDFPIVKKPQLLFSLHQKDGKKVTEKTLSLGESQTLFVIPGKEYVVYIRMQQMSRLLRPFNWRGKFNTQANFTITAETSTRLVYNTPTTLRSSASLEVHHSTL